MTRKGHFEILGCGVYRMAMPYRKLSEYGFNSIVTNRLDIPITQHDVFALQRQHADGVLDLTKKFKQKGHKVIFELDDYFHEIPAENPAGKAYPRGGKELKNMEEFMKLSDLMTVSTEGLKRNYSKFSNNIVVCPNTVELDKFPKFTYEPYETGQEFRLLWAGSGTHLPDLKMIVKPISELMFEFPFIKLIFIGMNYQGLFPYALRSRMEDFGHTFPMQANGQAMFYSKNGNPVWQYYDLLAKPKVHAAIAPLWPVIFNNSKSAIKLLEYGSSGIPFVATDFGPYSGYVHSTKDTVGLLADTNSNWKRQVKRLIHDENLRKSLIFNNFENIKKNHVLDIGISKWIEALKSIGLEPPGGTGVYEERIVDV